MANLNEEKRLWKRGFKCVVGIDEVGRGPLAGPVVACAVAVRAKFKSQKSKVPPFRRAGKIVIQNSKLLGIVKDSKQLSVKKRDLIYHALTNSPLVEWGIGRVSERVIDKINIFEATKLAMKKALEDLTKKLENQCLRIFRDRGKYANIDFVILDGNFILSGLKINGKEIPQKSIIKGDEKVFSCAAASIIAKVHRDRIMVKFHKKYPQFGFDRHKGYGTELHIMMLKKYGLCPIHRKSFRPVRN